MCKLPVESEGSYFAVRHSGEITFHLPGEPVGLYAGCISRPHEDIPEETMQDLIRKYYALGA
jgi:hypothetical protein